MRTSRWERFGRFIVFSLVSSVLVNVNTPFLGTFLDTPVTTRSNTMATSEKQNNLRTTRILPQAEWENNRPLLLLAGLMLISWRKLDLGFLKCPKHSKPVTLTYSWPKDCLDQLSFTESREKTIWKRIFILKYKFLFTKESCHIENHFC